MADHPFHVRGASSSPDAVHPPAGLRFLLAVHHGARFRLRARSCLRRLPAAAVFFTAGFVLAEGLHDLTVRLLVAPVFRLAIGIVAPGTPRPGPPCEPVPDSCLPVGRHFSPRDGWYVASGPRALRLHAQRTPRDSQARSCARAFTDGPFETCGVSEVPS